MIQLSDFADDSNSLSFGGDLHRSSSSSSSPAQPSQPISPPSKPVFSSISDNSVEVDSVEQHGTQQQPPRGNHRPEDYSALTRRFGYDFFRPPISIQQQIGAEKTTPVPDNRCGSAVASNLDFCRTFGIDNFGGLRAAAAVDDLNCRDRKYNPIDHGTSRATGQQQQSLNSGDRRERQLTSNVMDQSDGSSGVGVRQTDLTSQSQIDIGLRRSHIDMVARSLHGQFSSSAEIEAAIRQTQNLKQSFSLSDENISHSSPEPPVNSERPNSVKSNIPLTPTTSIDLASASPALSSNYAAAAANLKLIKSEQPHSVPENCSSVSDYMLQYSERSGQRTPAPLDLGKPGVGAPNPGGGDLLSPVRSEAGDHRHGGDHISSPTNQNGPKFPDVYFMDPQFTPNDRNGRKSPVSAENDDPTSSNSDVKFGIEEACPVCGDKVSGYHYGLLTCESCKGFFKRTVQNKKVYSCVDNRSCQIDKTQRKRCPYCRFQKCLQVGMKLEAVRADRMRGGRNKFGPMYKRDRAIKQQAMRQQQQLLQQYQHQLQQIHHQSNAAGNNGANVERDIKPDITLLQQHQQALNSGQVNGMDLSQDSVTSNNSSIGSSNNNNATNNPALYNPAMYTTNSLPQTSFPGLLNPLQNIPQLVPSSLRIVPPLISDLKSHELDENEIQQKIVALAQYQLMSPEPRTKQEIVLGMCKLADHCLFMLVEWARGALFFKELKVEDQMKLLQSCWSELLIIEYISRLVKLRNSQSPLRHDISHLDFLVKIGLPDVKTRLLELGRIFDELKADIYEYTCLKFLILLNPDVIGLEERQFIEQSQEKINAALLEYCIRFYPDLKDKFGQLLLRLPEIRVISLRIEEFLYSKHINGEVLGQTLLLEMLHSKRK